MLKNLALIVIKLKLKLIVLPKLKKLFKIGKINKKILKKPFSAFNKAFIIIPQWWFCKKNCFLRISILKTG